MHRRRTPGWSSSGSSPCWRASARTSGSAPSPASHRNVAGCATPPAPQPEHQPIRRSRQTPPPLERPVATAAQMWWLTRARARESRPSGCRQDVVAKVVAMAPALGRGPPRRGRLAVGRVVRGSRPAARARRVVAGRDATGGRGDLRRHARRRHCLVLRGWRSRRRPRSGLNTVLPDEACGAPIDGPYPDTYPVDRVHGAPYRGLTPSEAAPAVGVRGTCRPRRRAGAPVGGSDGRGQHAAACLQRRSGLSVGVPERPATARRCRRTV